MWTDSCGKSAFLLNATSDLTHTELDFFMLSESNFMRQLYSVQLINVSTQMATKWERQSGCQLNAHLADNHIWNLICQSLSDRTKPGVAWTWAVLSMHSLLLYPLDPVFHLMSALFDFYSVTGESRGSIFWAIVVPVVLMLGVTLEILDKKSLTPLLALLAFDRWIHANNRLLLTKWQFNSRTRIQESNLPLALPLLSCWCRCWS